MDNRIFDTLESHGLIDARRRWSLESAHGGLNSRVVMARRDGVDQPAYTIRIGEGKLPSVAEIEGLSAAAGCPGVPRVRLVTDEILVHDFVPGAPRTWQMLELSAMQSLARSLTCLHAKTYVAFTPWPSLELRHGSRADLLNFRINSLENYDSYPIALEEPGDLARLLQRLLSLDLASPSWKVAKFSRLHGDLSRGNLLWDGDSVGLIDWEYSRVGDPAEDLAYLMTEFEAGPEQALEFLALYTEAGGDSEPGDRLAAYALFTAVDSALWWTDYGKQRGIDTTADVEQRVATAQSWLKWLDATTR